MKIDKILLAAVCLVIAGGASAAIEHAPWPGGIAVIELGPADAPAPAATFNDRPVLVMKDGQRWRAVVGIPLDTAPGEATIEVGDRRVAFNVVEHAYREQRLTVKNKSYVSPDPEQLERVGKERKIIDAALGNFRGVDADSVALAAPVEGRRSSSFGLRRFFYEQPRSPH